MLFAKKMAYESLSQYLLTGDAFKVKFPACIGEKRELDELGSPADASRAIPHAGSFQCHFLSLVSTLDPLFQAWG